MSQLNEEAPDNELYTTHIFHDPHIIDHLVTICRKQLPHLVLISAPEEFGKQFLIESVICRLQEEFYKTGKIIIDAARLSDLQTDNEYIKWLRETDPGEALEKAPGLFDAAADLDTDLLVVYVKNSLELDSIRTHWLITAIAGNPKILLVLSDIAFIHPDRDRLPVKHTVYRLSPHAKAGMKTILKGKYKKNNFNSVFYDALHAYSFGYPQYLAEGIDRLLKAGFLERGTGERWLFDAKRFLAGGGQECLARKLKGEIEEILSEYESTTAIAVREVFHFGALCGSIIPLEHIYNAITDRQELHGEISAVLFEHFMENNPLPLFKPWNFPKKKVVHLRYDDCTVIYADLEFLSPAVRKEIEYHYCSGNQEIIAGKLFSCLRAKTIMRDRDWIRMLHRLFVQAHGYPMSAVLPYLPGWINLHNPIMAKELILKVLQNNTLMEIQCFQYIRNYHCDWPPAIVRGLIDALFEVNQEVSEDIVILMISAINYRRLGDTGRANSLLDELAEECIGIFGRQEATGFENLHIIELLLYLLIGSWPPGKIADCLIRLTEIRKEWMADHEIEPDHLSRNAAFLYLQSGQKEKATVIAASLFKSTLIDPAFPYSDDGVMFYARLIWLAGQVEDRYMANRLESRKQEYLQTINKKDRENIEKELASSLQTNSKASPDVIAIRSRLALSHMYLNEHETAISMQRENIEMLKTSSPGEIISLLAAENTLAQILTEAGRLQEAHTILHDVLKRAEQNPDFNPWNLLRIKKNLAHILLEMKEPQQALSVYNDVVEKLCSYIDLCDAEMHSASEFLACIYSALGDVSRAQTIMEDRLHRIIYSMIPDTGRDTNVELIDFYSFNRYE